MTLEVKQLLSQHLVRAYQKKRSVFLPRLLGILVAVVVLLTSLSVNATAYLAASPQKPPEVDFSDQQTTDKAMVLFGNVFIIIESCTRTETPMAVKVQRYLEVSAKKLGYEGHLAALITYEDVPQLDNRITPLWHMSLLPLFPTASQCRKADALVIELVNSFFIENDIDYRMAEPARVTS